jgi:hypothetical protein
MKMPVIWKEWRQQRWRMAFSTVMLVGIIGSTAAAHIVSASEVFVVLCLAGALLLPLYSAMGTFAPEQTARTFEFYATKTASPLRVFAAKWFFGWLNTVVPVIAALCFAILVAGSSVSPLLGPDAEHLPFFLACLALGTILYTMTCCLARFRSSEAEAGVSRGYVWLLVACRAERAALRADVERVCEPILPPPCQAMKTGNAIARSDRSVRLLSGPGLPHLCPGIH